jgi:uncharacterized protein YegP (UPF0339 family)
MATATKQARTARQRADGVPSEFVVFESNSGEYRWEIVSGTGATLAQSVPFTSSEAAEAAAVRVREGAGASRLAPYKAPDRDRPFLVASRSPKANGR